jgi:transcription initiation factor TFIIB
VGSESETLSNEKANTDPSRVSSSENGLLEVTDLSTVVGPSTSSALINEHGC